MSVTSGRPWTLASPEAVPVPVPEPVPCPVAEPVPRPEGVPLFACPEPTPVPFDAPVELPFGAAIWRVGVPVPEPVAVPDPEPVPVPVPAPVDPPTPEPVGVPVTGGFLFWAKTPADKQIPIANIHAVLNIAFFIMFSDGVIVRLGKQKSVRQDTFLLHTATERR